MHEYDRHATAAAVVHRKRASEARNQLLPHLIESAAIFSRRQRRYANVSG
jgi:hypothetical protein